VPAGTQQGLVMVRPGTKLRHTMRGSSGLSVWWGRSVGEDVFDGGSNDCLNGGFLVERKLEEIVLHRFGDAGGEHHDFFGVWLVLVGWHRGPSGAYGRSNPGRLLRVADVHSGDALASAWDSAHTL
jgi:hypothetical protein